MPSEIIECVSLILEIRPRLKSANVFIKFSRTLNNCPSVILEKNSVRVILEQKTLDIPCKEFNVVANSLSNVKFNENFFVFRFSTQNVVEERGRYKTELLLNTDDKFGSSLNKPLLVADTNYIIYCINCKRALSNTVRFNRVLPLPSENSNPNDWFCHNHEHSNFDFSPKSDDLFYAHSHVHMHISNIPFVKNSSGVFVCKHCLNWIGVKNNKKTVRLWHNTTKFVNNTKSIESSSLSDILQAIRHGLTDLSTSTRLIITCQTSSQKMDVLLLWILEKKLQILFKKSKAIGPYDVAKVLFKFVNSDDASYNEWDNHPSVNAISVSKPMFVDLLKHLYKFNKGFPTEFAESNGFYISYLFLYDTIL